MPYRIQTFLYPNFPSEINFIKFFIDNLLFLFQQFDDAPLGEDDEKPIFSDDLDSDLEVSNYFFILKNSKMINFWKKKIIRSKIGMSMELIQMIQMKTLTMLEMRSLMVKTSLKKMRMIKLVAKNRCRKNWLKHPHQAEVRVNKNNFLTCSCSLYMSTMKPK